MFSQRTVNLPPCHLRHFEESKSNVVCLKTQISIVTAHKGSPCRSAHSSDLNFLDNMSFAIYIFIGSTLTQQFCSPQKTSKSHTGPMKLLQQSDSWQLKNIPNNYRFQPVTVSMNAKKSTFTKRVMVQISSSSRYHTDISPSAENTCVKLNKWQLTYFRRWYSHLLPNLTGTTLK